ncbi:MAG: hypothetical protein ILP07_02105 [Treponema sp.]|nr:hypothetical protein [Treponema sp.]
MQNARINESRVNKIKKILLLLLMAFTISTLLYTAHEMHHECSGEDCHICQVIQISVQSLKLLTFALATVFVSQNFKNVKTYKDSIIVKSVLKPNTLISQKIRLND